MNPVNFRLEALGLYLRGFRRGNKKRTYIRGVGGAGRGAYIYERTIIGVSKLAMYSSVDQNFF